MSHFLQTASDIKAISQDKLGRYGVNYFEYLRVYNDGQGIVLASNPELMQYVFDHEIPIAAPLQEQYIQNNFHYFILSIGGYEKVVHDVKSHFHLAHFLNVVERHPGYIDLYCFGADANNPGIMNFYLNKMEILDNFKQEFKEKAQPLIKQALRTKIQFSASMMPEFKGLEEDASFKNRLTQRQEECLKHLVQGMSLKQIAKHLSLSPRTVEHYLESVKMKLDCNSRVELFAKAKTLLEGLY